MMTSISRQWTEMNVRSNRYLLWTVTILIMLVTGACSKDDDTQQATAPKLEGGETTLPSNHPDISEAIKQQKSTHFRVGSNNVKNMYIDGNMLWLATSGGVVRYDTSTDEYKLFDHRHGLLSKGIFFVSKIGDRIAVGTYGGGMGILDSETGNWENINVPQGLADAFVYEVLEFSNGDVWIATWSGANRVKGGDLWNRDSWEWYNVENTQGGLPNDWVYGLAEGKDGIVWLATEGGLARFKDGVWTNWAHDDGLGAPYEQVKKDIEFQSDPSQFSKHHAQQKIEQGLTGVDTAYNPNYIISMDVDSKGVVWCGTWGAGLARFDGTNWRNFTVDDGLPGNHIFMLHRDRNGVLWIGTSKGLARYDEANNTFTTMTTADGLFADSVFSMADASDGSIWVGSFGGVAHIRR